MLMLLSVHVTSVLFLVLAGNFALTMGSIGVTRSYSSRPFLHALDIVQRKQSLNGLVSWVFVGEQVHACGPCNTI